MTSTFNILATVELLHEYYVDGRCTDFSFVPDAATEALLRGSGILHRSIGNALILLTKVNESGIAERHLPTESVLRFQLALEQPRMLNYSNLELPEGKAYHFSNRLGGVAADGLYLNRPVPAFSGTGSYKITALAAQGSTIFEAIRPVTNNDHTPGDTAFWQARAANRYVHTQDLLPRSDGRIRMDVPAASAFTIETFAFNPATEAFDIPAAANELQQYEAPVTAIRIDRSSLRSGRYLIRVNGTDFEQHIDAAGNGLRSLGSIELWNRADTTSEFSLYLPDGSPRGASFLLRFANRLALWKYRVKTGAATGINIPGQPGAFVSGPQPLEFLSVRPMPLREEPLRNIQLMRGADVLASRLANPPPERISIHSDGGLTWYCAEMRLNY